MFAGQVPQPTVQYDPFSGTCRAAPPQPNASPLAAPISSDPFAYLLVQSAQKPPDQGVRGTWTHQENNLLIQAVTQLGTAKWMEIAKFVPTRTPKQCRERWFNRLAPWLRKGAFEPWEDEVIRTKQAQLGNRWAVIAQSLVGRSAVAVKNRWYSRLRTAQAGAGAELVTGGLIPP
jgi:hypothetical protein